MLLFTPMNGKTLVEWYLKNKRDLPWRKTKDPYAIWVSEIMLQQTQVKKVIPYYIEFLQTFSTLHKLAQSEESEVLQKWSGLGYYRRARNLRHGAQFICEAFNGVFPENFEDVLKIPGIGDYTASAITSIAFEKPYIVVDGNVLRVTSRFYGIKKDLTKKEIQKNIKEKLKKTLGNLNPSDFNQGMMELGALICTPQNPTCLQCPLRKNCYAFLHHEQENLPLKKEKQDIKKIFKQVALLQKNKKFLLIKQENTKILNDLWLFPEIETKKIQTFYDKYGIKLRKKKALGEIKHHVTFRRMHLNIFEAELLDFKPKTKNFQWIDLKKLGEIPHSSLTSKIAKLIK
ncbi:MAG: A/G-specific adenine glycosylase [Deltaproteobacteria bacterium]|nr:A/G-specific adenine glycosylase [Deltaproteobacteria bacterium]